MIANNLLVTGASRFNKVYASEFEGDLKGNADTATSTTYVRHNVSNASYGRPILLAYDQSPADGGSGLVYYDSAVTVNPSTNTITASTFTGNLEGNAKTATTATKVGTSTIGSATQPVYINAGVPTKCTYTLGKSVPSDAKFTDTTYTLGSFGITATAAELNYCDGVTSNIQTQLNGKSPTSHTHTTISNDLSIEGMLTTKPIKFNSYYKQFSATESGWYRIYTGGSNSSGKGTCIFTLGRNYWSPQNEEYVFSVNVGYNGDINITQLSGVIGGQLITKIRVVYKNSSPYYIDFYSGTSGYENSYYVHGMGYGTFQTPTLVESIEEGYSTYEFSTVAGCKSDKGFYGNLTGNVTGNASTANNVTPEWSGSISYNDTNWLAAWTSDGTKIKALDKSNFATVSSVNSKVSKTALFLSGRDLNTVIESGFYRLSDGHVNAPSNASWGQMIVAHGGGDTITQIIGSYNTGSLFTRSGNPTEVGGTGTWKDWRTLIDSSNYTSYITPASIGASKVKIVRW